MEVLRMGLLLVIVVLSHARLFIDLVLVLQVAMWEMCTSGSIPGMKKWSLTKATYL